MNKGIGASAKKFILYMVMIFLSVVFVLPFVQIIGTSLKSYIETKQFPPTIFPGEPKWDNYLEIFRRRDILLVDTWILNTVFTTCIIVFGLILSCSFISYGFARFEGRGKKLWFMLIISTMLIPIYVVIIPLAIIFKTIGWTGTYLPLIVQPFFGQAMYIFLFRQFIMGIPRDMDEAAIIDGSSYLSVFFRIIIPLIKPVIATVGVISFIAAWSDMFTPLIFLTNMKMYTISVALAIMNSQYASSLTETHLIAVVTVIATIPTIIVFFSAQKYFVGGLTAGAIKN